MAHPALLAVGDESEATEVDLELDPWRWVVHAHGDRASSGSATLDGEPGQSPVRDHHATTLEEDPDLDDGQPVGDPRFDAFFFGQQRPPRFAVTVDTVRAYLLEHLADQFVAELLFPAGAVDPEIDGGSDVAPCRLAVDADPMGDGALALTL